MSLFLLCCINVNYFVKVPGCHCSWESPLGTCLLLRLLNCVLNTFCTLFTSLYKILDCYYYQIIVSVCIFSVLRSVDQGIQPKRKILLALMFFWWTRTWLFTNVASLCIYQIWIVGCVTGFLLLHRKDCPTSSTCRFASLMPSGHSLTSCTWCLSNRMCNVCWADS